MQYISTPDSKKKSLRRILKKMKLINKCSLECLIEPFLNFDSLGDGLAAQFIQLHDYKFTFFENSVPQASLKMCFNNVMVPDLTKQPFIFLENTPSVKRCIPFV